MDYFYQATDARKSTILTLALAVPKIKITDNIQVFLKATI